MKKIIISACLVGRLVRYDGVQKSVANPVIKEWLVQGMLHPFCPEVAGGLPVPRDPAEIINGDGAAVLEHKASILDKCGMDVTNYFLHGAELFVQEAKRLNIKFALLKDGSPSCGTTYIYDGSFSGRLKKGRGVTAAFLEQKGIRVFNEKGVDDVLDCLNGKKHEN